MTNGDLIEQLSKYPKDWKLDFMLFTNLTMRRADVSDDETMIKPCLHDNHVCIMIDLPKYFEEEIRNNLRK